MHFLKYTIILPLQSQKDHYIAYNTLTSTIVLIDRELKNAIRYFKKEKKVKDALSKLEKLGIIVSDQTDDLKENAVFNYYLNKRKFDTSTVAITIYLTYKCNLACRYCYLQKRSAQESRASMSKQCTEQTIKWIEKFVKIHRGKFVWLNFLGGEPLLEFETIRIIVDSIRIFSEHRKSTFSFSITTNGTLLTPPIVDCLNTIGVQEVCVSVDGPQKIHDSRRAFKSGEGSFSQIMGNLEYAIKKLNVAVLLTVDIQNAQYVPQLLDFLRFRFREPLKKRKLLLSEAV